MALKERLARAPGSSQGVAYNYRSKIDRWLDSLTPSDRDVVLAALKDESGWPSKRLALALAEEGFDISGPAIRTYREKRAWERRTDGPKR